MPTTDIFIKTYHADIPWLRESIRSANRKWSGHRRIVVVCPPELERTVRDVAPKTKIIPVLEVGSGYIFQQAVKLNAHNYTDADYIVFCDSDCIWTKPTTPETYIRPDGRPFLLYTPYPSIPDAIHWKAPTENALGHEVFAEFMRRHPAVYKSATLRKMDDWFVQKHGVPASQLMLRMGAHWGASEFNWMGAWAWYHAHEDFHWINTTTEPLPELHLEQFWSYGGPDHPSNAERFAAALRS